MNRHLTLFVAFVCIAAALAVSRARGSVLLELSGGYLKNSSGVKVANGSGLLVLVASIGDEAFTPITADTVFTAGNHVTADSDDVIVAVRAIAGDGNSSGADDAGEFRQAIEVEPDESIPSGSPLQLCWFPTLAAKATSAPAGTPYGAYRTDAESGAVDADGSAAWVLPSDGTTGHALMFLTSDAGSNLHAATAGTEFGEPELAVLEGTSTVATPTPTPATSGDTMTRAAFLKRLAALRKQLAAAKQIRNVERRAKRVAAIRAKIQALVKTYRNSHS